MATVAPWLIPPNFLGAAEAGASAGLNARRLGDEENQFAQRLSQEQQMESQRQSDAADRLKLSYDQLAQQHDLTQQQIAARAGQAQAAQALREQSMDSLNKWRQQQAQVQQQRLLDQENKIAAAARLKDTSEKDINGFGPTCPTRDCRNLSRPTHSPQPNLVFAPRLRRS